jgi:hypothetical protein
MTTSIVNTEKAGTTEFRVGHYSARCSQRDTFMGPEFQIELFWHEPETGIINDVATFGRDVVDACAALQFALLGDSLASAQGWLAANCRWSPPGAFARALDRVVSYLWTSEERDYLSREPNDRAGHIFEAVMLLRDYAAKP